MVAACTPKTHEPLFQETVTNAGINKYLFEMANIRNQCSWVHGAIPAEATEKAKELTRMAVAKVALLEALSEPVLEINQSALVIGGGFTGMTAAQTLSQQGYHAIIVEKEDRLGGQARHLYETWRGEDIQQNLAKLIEAVMSDEKIDVYLNAEITKVDGFVGNFKTTIKTGDKVQELDHGVTIIASGATELKPDLYLYGQDPRVLTALELDRKLIENDPALKEKKTAAFHSMRRLAHSGTPLLLQGLLHPFHQQRSEAERTEPGHGCIYSIPGHAFLRVARRSVPGGPGQGHHFYPLTILIKGWTVDRRRSET